MKLITQSDDERYADICSTGYASPDDLKLLTRSLYAALKRLDDLSGDNFIATLAKVTSERDAALKSLRERK
jgi:hypothetical protein